jgi:hypothetical protein
MAKVVQRNMIQFRAPNHVGLLADVTERLYAKSINVLAVRSYDEGDDAVILIYADDSRAAITAIETLSGGTVQTVPVISAEVKNTPGQLAALSRALANADVNVTQLHCTTTDAPTAEIVLQTGDNIAAMAALERM